MANKKRVVGYIAPELESDWNAYVKKLGIGESAAVEWTIRRQLEREAGDNSKEKMLESVLAALDEQRIKLDMLHTEKWTQVQAPDGKIQITMKLDDSDLERVAKAIEAHK